VVRRCSSEIAAGRAHDFCVNRFPREHRAGKSLGSRSPRAELAQLAAQERRRLEHRDALQHVAGSSHVPNGRRRPRLRHLHVAHAPDPEVAPECVQEWTIIPPEFHDESRVAPAQGERPFT
jgi:hypothetical protein